MTSKEIIKELEKLGFTVTKTASMGTYSVNSEQDIRFKKGKILMADILNNEVIWCPTTLEDFVKYMR